MIISMFVATGLALGLGLAFSSFSNGTPQIPQLNMGTWIPLDLSDDSVVDMVEQKKMEKEGGGAAQQEETKRAEAIDNANSEEVEVVEDEIVKPWIDERNTMTTQSSSSGSTLGGQGAGTGNGTGTGTGKEDENEGGDEVETYSQILPEFPGGYGAMQTFIKKHFRLSQLEIERGVSGTLWFTFVVRKDGTVSNVTLSRGIQYEDALAERALKVIQSMPTWKPGYTGDVPVNVRYSIPIRIEVK
jgi:protein TonB